MQDARSQAASSKQPTAISQQPTANNRQQLTTANSQQPTANSQQPITNNAATKTQEDPMINDPRCKNPMQDARLEGGQGTRRRPWPRVQTHIYKQNKKTPVLPSTPDSRIAIRECGIYYILY
jgi:hypothetical protein